MKIKKRLIAICFIFSALTTIAQSSLDCSTSTITSCAGNPTFPFNINNTSNTYGSVQDLPNNSTSSISNPALNPNPSSSNNGCLLSGELNPTWIVINISSTGTFNFVMSQNGFTDWAMWPYTSNTCNNIQNNTLAPISCNYNASPFGGTGIGPVPFLGSAGNFEPTLNVVAGQAFIMCVSNFSNVMSTVSLSFSGSAGTSCVPFTSTTSKTICPAGTATLIATTNLANPSFTWMPGSLNTRTVVVSPSSTTIYSITIAGTNTLTSALSTTVITGTVTVLPTPTITLTSNSLVCPNSIISLVANSGFSNYFWSGPAGYNQTTTTPTSAIANANTGIIGTYTVFGQTAQSCTAIATTTVGLILTSTVATQPSYTLCEGGLQTFTGTIATGATSYSWTGPAGFSSQIQNPTIPNIVPSQSGTYTVTALFVSGTSTCSTNATATIFVIPSIPAALPSIATVCNNGIINLSAPVGAIYNWSGPNTFTSSVQNPIITNASTLNNGTYTVSITSGLCVNSGTVNVLVYPILNFSISPSGVTLCSGKTSTLNSLGNGGSGAYSYDWQPSIGLQSPNAAFTNVTGNISTIYTVTISDANCSITNNISATATVIVNSTPIISINPIKNRGCEPYLANIIGTSIPSSNNCVWHFSNNIVYNGCNISDLLFPIKGIYGAVLRVTDISGCIDSLRSDSLIIVDPRPNANFIWTPNNPTVLSNEVAFFDQSTIGLPIINWNWDFGDVFLSETQDTSNLPNPFHIYENPYTYSVTLNVTNSFGCTDSLIKTIKIEDELAVYIPNAFSPMRSDGKNDVFKVYGNGFKSDGFEMQIFSRNGELVYKTNDVQKGWDGSVKGGKSLKQEVYVYKITLINYKNAEKQYVGNVTIL